MGSFVVASSSISISYNPQQATGRLKAELDDVTITGTAQISDFIINDPNFSVNECFTPVVHPINFTLVGATIGPAGFLVNMSYANGLLGDPLLFPPDFLQMYYKQVGGSWQVITANALADPAAHNGNSMTIISDPDFLSQPLLTHSGLFTLGFDNGCSGGGSGGLVRPGLVLDLLAAAGASEKTVAPPSFGGSHYHYSDGLTLTQGTHKTIFDTSKYNQEIPTQVMLADQKVNMTFKTFEGYNPTGVIHMGLYIIPRGQDMITTNSIGSIVYDKSSPVKVSDPNHILANVTASSSSDGKFQYFQFSFVPTKSYDKMSFLARAWNDHLYSTDVRVHDAVDRPTAQKTLPAGVIKYDTFDTLQAALEKDGFYKPQIMTHIHSTRDVFTSNEAGHVYWLYDNVNHLVTLVIADKNDSELYSNKEPLEPFVQDKKGDYGFMHFTVKQLNRADQNQEENEMKLEAAKAMLLALEKRLIPHSNW